MSKELFISSSPHETKVAVMEDDELVEVFYEHDTDVGLVGGIYKGRVNRVLPGMQSAFVDIGLERDAFLYVSDFYLEDEEYDKIFDEAEARAVRYVANQTPAAEAKPESTAAAAGVTETTQPTLSQPTQASEALASSPATGPATEEPGYSQSASTPAPGPPSGNSDDFRRSEHRGRRRRHRGRGHHEYRPSPKPETSTSSAGFEILPGESLAKYSHMTTQPIPEGLIPEADATVSEPSTTTEEPVPSAETAPGEAGTTDSSPSSLASDDLSVTSSEEVVLPATSHTEEATSAEPEAGKVSPDIDSATVEATVPPTEAAPPAPTETAPRETQAEVPQPAVSEPEPVTSEVVPASTKTTTEAETPAPTKEAEAPRQELSPSEEVSISPPTVEGEPANTPEVSPSGADTPSDQPAPESSEEQHGAPASTADEPSQQSYTLREPYQRPRYAPRRGRRGRRRQPPTRPASRQEPSRSGNTPARQISELLKEGQEVLVQIAKEPLGTKGARITSHIALPGRYLVYMPTIDHIGVSRKISSEQERLRLRNILLENRGSLTGGFIVRTAAEGRSEDEFKADIKFLLTLWNQIKSTSEQTKAPALIHSDLSLVQRILRDALSADFKCVRVDNEIEYERVLDFVNRSQPSLVGKVKLYLRDMPLFEEFGIQSEIEKALKPKVWLKSGGHIVINQTEALVAVDVNTGKYVGKTNRLEDTILKTNIDAVHEIVRQVRLRDLGGIIVIDFIDLDERRNRVKLVQALEEALRKDRAPTKVISFHDFGLVAITRKRVKQSLERTLCEPCDYCSGAGWVKSPATVSLEILAEVRKMAKQLEGNVVTIRVNPSVARALKSHEGSLIGELESMIHKDVIVKTDPTVHQEHFDIF